ncbi:nitroreductase family protein [Pseudobacteroides cellulosolvens]|uniref:Nitroreductase n=1 Tax=Pseudobacteroides cellulosolvens ATCC 35603 = DSM 2933 TaxID=398512 RepID=A0A0L6JLB8_9FIRM|nr:nitroreductase family protein [Pseudobacteroides cellulosolvens]KNY26569.1 nitroreductase [Pseudobacteroides cellulosolvens ATCC 35603 = DSM 2933]
MVEKSRSEYVMKNAAVSLIMQLVRNILGFISRTVFVKVLGAEYLGVNGLFTEILTVLSFAELGIGNAMVFSLYKPLAERNQEKIKSLMHLYARSYQVIGIVVAILGVLAIPFLKYIVGDVAYVKENITLLYSLFLLNSVLSYFFVYKKSLIIADQKNYIIEVYQQVFFAAQVLLQSVFLIITKQFIIYLIIVVACTFLNNFYVALKADKLYPYLKDKNTKPLQKSEVADIVKNIKALVVYKVGGIVLESTNSIFISTLINVVTVGLYSNYKMLVNIFKTVGSQVMNSVVASVGNLNASGTDEKKEAVFNEMFFLNIWFYGFTAVGLCAFLSELVSVWLGSKYIIGFDAVLAACVYYYMSNMHFPCYTYRTTAGLFIYGKYVPIFAAILNIVFILILGMNFGLAGILWASTISRFLTYEIIDPVLIYRRVFHKNVLHYFIMYITYSALIIVDGLISYRIAAYITVDGFVGFLLRAVVLTVVFNIVFVAATFKSNVFRSLYMRIDKMVLKKLRRNKKAKVRRRLSMVKKIKRKVNRILRNANEKRAARRVIKLEYCVSGGNKSKGETNNEVILLLLAHSLEKGMGLPTPRVGFGKEKAENLILQLEKYIAENGDTSRFAFVESMAILDAYLKYSVEQHCDVELLIRKFDKIRTVTTFDNVKAGTTVVLSMSQIYKNLNMESITYFLKSRHSIRSYEKKPIDDDVMYKVIQMANLAPSACNRQPIKVYWTSDLEVVAKINQLIPGNEGFEDQVPNWALVTADRLMFGVTEPMQWYVNGGIYLSYLVESFHANAIGSCIFQIPAVHPNTQKLYEIAQVSKNEVIVAAVGFGYPTESNKWLAAERRSVEETLIKF